MIRYDIQQMLEKLEGATGENLNLMQLSEEAGVNRNAISRMINQPWIYPSTKHVNDLIQFFYERMRTGREGIAQQKRLMNSIVRDFITVYPDNMEYWSFLPALSAKPKSDIDTVEDYLEEASSMASFKKKAKQIIKAMAAISVDELWKIAEHGKKLSSLSGEMKELFINSLSVDTVSVDTNIRLVTDVSKSKRNK